LLEQALPQAPAEPRSQILALPTPQAPAMMASIYMSVLSASTRTPVVLFQHQNSNAVTSLGPTLDFALQCQQTLSKMSFSLLLRSWLVAAHLFILSKPIAARSATAAAEWSVKASWSAWNSQPVRRIRKKFEFEFFTFVLGCGNSLCLLMFWPGWWVLAFFTLAIWAFAG
jgi:hypothetical protein